MVRPTRRRLLIIFPVTTAVFGLLILFHTPIFLSSRSPLCHFHHSLVLGLLLIIREL
ncbi:hypothetical protein HanXRQr2_Chr14g0642991 [Helianthus annuus]|uniref:Uncharacterized protein n=1 Tax=Helianthus annuus TaxID=4232 RepID=A0A9K3E9K4_HELAN|nr:hypothetical protein HanXRQr2_Chr14g0642991 [Helianthus annuus]KAJ0840285.1 hypothetical protein HanPSC8_Chr14g0616871 [Helianthus annuus]